MAFEVMSNSKQDESVLNAQVKTGQTGVELLLQSAKNGTAEVRNLLTHECDIILECR